MDNMAIWQYGYMIIYGYLWIHVHGQNNAVSEHIKIYEYDIYSTLTIKMTSIFQQTMLDCQRGY